MHLFLNEFTDSKDSGTAILSHFYLLAGCAAPLWLEGPEVLSFYGVLVLGVGDALVRHNNSRAARALSSVVAQVGRWDPRLTSRLRSLAGE